MNKHKNAIYIFITIILSICFCLFLYQFDNKYTHQSTQPINGIIYLEDEDFALNKVLYLSREWEYFPDALLTPDTLPQYDGYRKYVDIGGKYAMPHGSATYRLILMLPSAEASYALEMPEIFSACKLYIDGKPLLQLGNIDPQQYSEGICNRVIPFTAGGKTEILLAVSDFSAVYSGLNYPPAFGIAQNVLRVRSIRLLLHSATVLIAILGIGLAIAFGIKGNLRRGILCNLIFLCLIGYTAYPLFHSLRITSFNPWYTLEAMCYYGLLLLAILLQCDLYEVRGKFTFFLALPCALGTLFAIVRVLGAAYWNIEISIAFSFISLFIKYYFAACILLLSCWALWRRKKYSVLLMSASMSFAVFLGFDRFFPLYEPIFGGWLGEVGGVILIAALASALWLDAMDAYRFRLTYEGNYHHMEQRLLMQKEYYQQLSEQIQRSREAAHDMRHHMRILRTIAGESTQNNRLIAYLDSYEPHLTQQEVNIWSNHSVADAIIGYYAPAAKRLNATYDVRLAIPPEINFPDDELCILLSNLLENATEALSRQQQLPRKIYLRGDFQNGRLGIVLDNSYSGAITKRDDKYISSKHEGFGFGISSVCAIVKKYGGLADFSADANTFHASIMIPIPVLKEQTDTPCNV
ncbi:MAG: GHKL domain-containing protein [Oscillospiraceae bacterium]